MKAILDVKTEVISTGRGHSICGKVFVGRGGGRGKCNEEGTVVREEGGSQFSASAGTWLAF